MVRKDHALTPTRRVHGDCLPRQRAPSKRRVETHCASSSSPPLSMTPTVLHPFILPSNTRIQGTKRSGKRKHHTTHSSRIPPILSLPQQQWTRLMYKSRRPRGSDPSGTSANHHTSRHRRPPTRRFLGEIGVGKDHYSNTTAPLKCDTESLISNIIYR